jgi:Transposase IS66 family
VIRFGAARYGINAAAIASMRGADLPQDVIDKLAGHASPAFGAHKQWMEPLRALGIADLRVTPDPVRTTSEAALWGAIEAEGLLGQAVIVSDDAGQFRLGDHALCWVHAERLVHKLVPANDKQSNAVKVARRMICWFYRRLKAYKLAPSPEQASLLRLQFDRIFKRRTGYATLDRLLKRLLGRKDELLRGLERPEIPLNTNASENDIRAFVTKRKISGGTVSQKGRQARDVMLGLAKTCTSTISAPAWAFQAPPSPISQPSSAPPNPNPSPGICPGYAFSTGAPGFPFPETSLVLRCTLGEFRTCAGSTATKKPRLSGLQIFSPGLQIHRPRHVIKAAARRREGPTPAGRAEARVKPIATCSTLWLIALPR